MQNRVSFAIGALTGLGAGIVIEQLRTISSQSAEVEREATAKVFKYGPPHSSVSTHSYTGHALGYDRSKKIPLWVAESVTKDHVHGKHADRENTKFRPDPALPSIFSATNEDYWKSGWSRGHMSPAGNHKHCQESMNDTFYLTNVVPQDIDNNSGYWNRLENFCRELTSKYDEVTIISGPVFAVQQSAEGRKFVHYEVIGERNVAVPTHLYKLIMAERDSEFPALAAFVVPNRLLTDESIMQFKVSLQELEKITGITFHSKLDRSKVQDLCEAVECKLMSHKEFSLWFYMKRVSEARKLEAIERTWKEIVKKGFETDEKLIQAYLKRRYELEEKLSALKQA